MCKKLCCVMMALTLLMTGCNAGYVYNSDQYKSASGNSAQEADEKAGENGDTGEADGTGTKSQAGQNTRAPKGAFIRSTFPGFSSL